MSQVHESLAAINSFLTSTSDAIAISPEAAVMTLFQAVAKDVPAYQDFLHQHQIDRASISTIDQFRSLPLITKDNYINAYPLSQRCWCGSLDGCDVLAMSSGSTGEPTTWPRSLEHEVEFAARFEQIFRESFQADERSTLAVICFPMGTWVGGVFTLSCCRLLSLKGYRITSIAPGNQPSEILRVVQGLGQDFDQVVLLGYPPFLKTVIDMGAAQGLQWADYAVKFVLAGEVFSEAWRSLMADRVGSMDPCVDLVSMYGTADAGVLGNETPLSITIRRWMAEHPERIKQFFGEARLPTLLQYDPRSRYFEVQDHSLIFTGNNGVPLIRYHIADKGGIIAFSEMMRRLKQCGFNPSQEGRTELIRDRMAKFPFVYVFGRSHSAVSYFGANVFAENVMETMECPPISDWVTGRFVMEAVETKAGDRKLNIVVELAPKAVASYAKEQRIAEVIRDRLRLVNSEFANYVPEQYQTPQVDLLKNGHPDYFPLGIKHQYTR